MTIKILLADDHTILRQGLRSLLEHQKDFVVVAEAENGRSAVKLAKLHKPDVVIIDITMPELNGIEATREILAEQPDIKIIALSMHTDKRFVVNMFNAGAVGYLRKNSAADELVGAIYCVMKDQIYLGQKIAGVMVKEDIAHYVNDEGEIDTSCLSSKERQVLQLVAEGKPTKLIADELNLSAKTIEKHRQHVMEKLNIHSVAELTKYAIREGLTELDK